MRNLIIGLVLFSIPAMFSCSQAEDTDQTETQITVPEESEAKTTEEASDTIRVEITSNDLMKYSMDEIRVKAGQTVVLTLKHVGRLPMTSMGHNWALLKQGADMAAFAQDAIQAKDNGYIPKSREDDVIAYTKMLGGGESDTITFKAPDKGTYTFLCSFPGHYMAMNGKFIVE